MELGSSSDSPLVRAGLAFTAWQSKIDIVSLAEIKSAIEQLSFEERAQLAACTPQNGTEKSQFRESK
ncbi:MAG: hypothetical protein DMF47_01885 [Verrucomicrobia bacterium]|nr:MAG: hypothetical protein DMF47_01885 [Verrucomicrobiota bacterium]